MTDDEHVRDEVEGGRAETAAWARAFLSRAPVPDATAPDAVAEAHGASDDLHALVESLTAQRDDLRRERDEALAEVARLRDDLKLNAAMLAHQCDLARDAEHSRDEALAMLAEQDAIRAQAWAPLGALARDVAARPGLRPVPAPPGFDDEDSDPLRGFGALDRAKRRDTTDGDGDDT